MGLKLQGIEVGIQVLDINADTGVSILQGTAVPGSIGTYDDEALVGSLYLKRDGETYQKKTSGSGADKWRRLANADDLLNVSWRSDIVKALTTHVAPAEGGTIDLGAINFSDDDTPFLDGSDFSLGDAILFGHGGTEEIHRITAIVGDVLTFTKNAAHAAYPIDPLTNNDAFLVRHYLPDSPDAQEKQALVMWNGSAYIKLGDVNWDIATGINLSGSYAASSGNVTNTDTVESAIEKLDGNLDNTSSIVGRNVQSDTHMGTYTGGLITDNQNTKQNIQELSDAIANQSNLTGVVGSPQILDEVLVDEIAYVKWEVVFWLESNPAQRRSVVIHAMHDGIVAPGTPTDATKADYDKVNILKIGASFTRAIAVIVSGVGAAQKMQLQVTGAAAAAVTFKSMREQIRF